MPMVWNADADAKVAPLSFLTSRCDLTQTINKQLFLGVLAQFKPLRSKLDYEALAAYMGPDCTHCAIENRLVRLRRQVDSISLSSSTTPKTTPSATPRKRKAAAPPKTPTKKGKGKEKNIMATEEDSETEVEQKPAKVEILEDEVETKVKYEVEEA
ncbi:hypothetical protein P170DRAFT_476170 [Aspergillus steynii IBT 23096]|uniref:Uncharacterized protein n=1 Tax=Aspergillus steynii IBT 23096 TaxID=1392250 RepID=A0A2I2G3N4_9EURO|nr:uncharacterized protein P170DRAFT_476170 [Aspergillus steynii IBT 23096]PLB47485.1 hypothetical protein P170DRAFT_476170 [Aspergillus steynii IBT 23096]